MIIHYDRMKPCPSPPGGFVPSSNTPLAPMQLPNEFPFKSSTARCHSRFFETDTTCTPTVGPVLVPCSVPAVQPSPHSTFASPPVANDNPPESSAPLEEETFPNRPPDSTLLCSSHVLEVVISPKCSVNTAVSCRSFLDDPFPEQQTVVPPCRSGFPINTSTRTKTITQRPLLSDVCLKNASSPMTTLSLIRRAEHNCSRLLRSNTFNQRHATAH